MGGVGAEATRRLLRSEPAWRRSETSGSEHGGVTIGECSSGDDPSRGGDRMSRGCEQTRSHDISILGLGRSHGLRRAHTRQTRPNWVGRTLFLLWPCTQFMCLFPSCRAHIEDDRSLLKFKNHMADAATWDLQAPCSGDRCSGTREWMMPRFPLTANTVGRWTHPFLPVNTSRILDVWLSVEQVSVGSSPPSFALLFTWTPDPHWCPMAPWRTTIGLALVRNRMFTACRGFRISWSALDYVC